MDFDEAVVKVQNKIGDDCVVTNIHTRPYGWVFFYTSRQYVETGDENYGLIGNSPFFISKSGELAWLSTAYPSTNLFLKNWEISHPDYEFPKPKNGSNLLDFNSETVLTKDEEDQITRITNTILMYGIQLKAEEVRFEVAVTQDRFRPVYRTGEDLQKLGGCNFYALIAQRFKQMADIPPRDKEHPNATQSGTIKIAMKDEKYDVAITATISENGEQLNLRIEAA